jgi:ankyrin repeat protein
MSECTHVGNIGECLVKNCLPCLKKYFEIGYTIEDSYISFALVACNDEIFSFLVEKNANINVCSNYYKHTPIFITIQQGRIERTLKLLQNGASLDIKDYQEKTPLDYCADVNMQNAIHDFLIKN